MEHVIGQYLMSNIASSLLAVLVINTHIYWHIIISYLITSYSFVLYNICPVCLTPNAWGVSGYCVHQFYLAMQTKYKCSALRYVLLHFIY